MKKFFITLLLLCSCLLTGCPNTSNDSLSTNENPNELNLATYGTILSWNKIEGTTKYEIYNAKTDRLIDVTEECYYDLGELERNVNVYVKTNMESVNEPKKSNVVAVENCERLNLTELGINNPRVQQYFIGPETSQIIITGVKTLQIKIESRTSDLNIILNNASFSTSLENGVISGDSSDDYTLSLICFGNNRISRDPIFGIPMPAIDVSNLSIKGFYNSHLSIVGGNGLYTDTSYPNGEVGIKTNSLTIDCELGVEGGRGGNGGNGGAAINVKSLFVSEKYEVYMRGGSGGSAQGDVIKAGNGAVAVIVETPCELPSNVTLKGGYAGVGDEESESGKPGPASSNVGNKCVNNPGEYL